MLRIEWYSKNYPSLSEILSFQVQDDQRSRMHLLGEGSFAKVFLVKFKAKSFKFLPLFIQNNTESLEDRLFAMKVFDKNEVRVKNSKKTLLQNEIECLREVRNIPGAIQLQTVLQSNKKVAVIMNYPGNYTLREFINDHWNIENGIFKFKTQNHKKEWQDYSQKVRCIIFNLVVTLTHMHDKKIYHRDIKPNNVILEPVESHPHQYKTHLIDFGFATKH